MSKPRIVVLASGRGSNFEAIARAVESGRLEADVAAVISDQPSAGVLDKARALGIEVKLVAPGPAANPEERRRSHERKILEEIRPYSPRFLVMAGYMRVVTSTLLDAFRSERGYTRITNVHPSLLPAFPGLRAYEQAFQHGAQVAGVTVHLVEEGVDEGPICAQEAFSITGCADADEVERRGLEVEHRLYPATLDWVLKESFQVENRGARRICVRPN
jgi:phosphoribosylglycinamide formyltransferase-1